MTCKKCIDTEAEHRKQIEEENAGTTRAAPREHIGVGKYVPPTGVYYRNEGNKHIPSRGCV